MDDDLKRILGEFIDLIPLPEQLPGAKLNYAERLKRTLVLMINQIELNAVLLATGYAVRTDFGAWEDTYETAIQMLQDRGYEVKIRYIGAAFEHRQVFLEIRAKHD